VVFLAVYVGSMFTPGLLDDADSTHAEAAREMVVTGDYVTLHVNGVRYLEKAPLPYWLVAFSYKVLGVNEFSTRLPMVLSVMLLGAAGALLGPSRVRRTDGDLRGTIRLHLRGGVPVHSSSDSGGAAEPADCSGAVFVS
jgi:4-amino-4-deoxy-L-arabinose transferase-like glycosyltransferase